MICCGSGSRAAGIVNKRLLASVALVAVAMEGRAVAADNAPALRTKAAAASSSDTWTGAYFGGHFGWGFSDLATAANPGAGEIFALPSIPSAGMLAGAQIGYNRQFNNNVVLGVEADLTFADYFGVRTVTEQVSGQESALFSNLRYFGTARGRI